MFFSEGFRTSAKLGAPVLVQLNRGDDDIAWVDANGYRRAVRLVALNTFNVDDPLLAVHLSDLALPALVFPPDDANLVVLADRKCASL